MLLLIAASVLFIKSELFSIILFPTEAICPTIPPTNNGASFLSIPSSNLPPTISPVIGFLVP